MSTKKLFLTVLAVVYLAIGFSQTQTLDGFRRINKSTISPILEAKEVKGYVLFYKSDKADSKNDNYGLGLYDEDLNKVNEIALKKPRNQFFLINNCYNGTAFGFFFFNRKEDIFEIVTYSSSLEKLGSLEIEEISKMDKVNVNQNLANGEESDGNSYNVNLYPVENKGFLRNGIVGTNRGYTLDMYSNELKPLWHFETDKNADDFESIIIYEVNSKFITACCIRRPNMMSRKLTYYLVVFEVETGKKILDQKLIENDKYQLSMNGLTYDKSKDEFLVIGDFYNEDDKPGINRSLGFYIKRYSTDGKETAKNYYAWNKEVAKSLNAEAKKSIEEGYMNFTHRVITGANGEIYILTEQYKTAVDGFGIAANALSKSGANSMTKAVVGNIIVFVLNPDLKLKEAVFVSKDKSNVTLPPGASYYGKGLIGLMTDFLGGFDYQFTQTSNDGTTFNSVYINYDKEKGEKTKKILGNIFLMPDGKLKIDKIDVSSKATSSFVYPAKPGYIMMVDFLKKQKQLGMKLIKLNK